VKYVFGYLADRPAVEPDPEHGIIGDALPDVVYDHEGHGWHIVSHEWMPEARADEIMH